MTIKEEASPKVKHRATHDSDAEFRILIRLNEMAIEAKRERFKEDMLYHAEIRKLLSEAYELWMKERQKEESK